MQLYKLSPKLKKWLLSIHILMVVTWLGGTMCMLALNRVAFQAASIQELAVTTRNIQVIDDIFIKAPALGALITGLLLAIFSNWGLTTYYWIIIKIVLTLALIVFGILGLNPWLADSIRLIQTVGWEVLVLPTYLFVRNMGIYGAVLSICLMTFMVVISCLKPWGKIRAARK